MGRNARQSASTLRAFSRLLPLLALLTPLLSGCSSVENAHRQKEELMNSYLAGRDGAAAGIIDRKLQSTAGSGDEVMWLLEAGSFRFVTGDYAESFAHLARAEALTREYDERATVSLRDVGSEAATAITNLNALPYRGLCRDRIMLPVYKALDCLGLGDAAGFRVEIFRLREAQNRVLADYRTFFEAEQAAIKQAQEQHRELRLNLAAETTRNAEFQYELEQVQTVAERGYGNFLNPLAIYLSAITFAREGDWENAHVDFHRLYRALPDHPLVQSYYKSILRQTGRPAPRALIPVPIINPPVDRNSIYLIFANGRSAAFRQVAVYFPIMTAWPVCAYYPAPHPYLEAAITDLTVRTVPLADMDAILSQEYGERLPGMIARITIGTLVKEGGSAVAAWAAWKQHEALGLAVLLGTAAYRAALNTADTRSWEILPKEFQIAHLPMPADRRLHLQLGGEQKELVFSSSCRSAIVYVNAPGPALRDCRVLEFKDR